MDIHESLVDKSDQEIHIISDLITKGMSIETYLEIARFGYILKYGGPNIWEPEPCPVNKGPWKDLKVREWLTAYLKYDIPR